MVLKSYAKLNLYLEVLNKRKDGYHNIKTVFEKISLHDTITLKPRRDREIKITCDSKQVPCDKTNLAYRSAALLRDKFGLDSGVDIKITKRIPVGAGLGGGSSNAACVLMGLNRLWKLNLTRDRLIGLAREIGSDVAFFIYDAPFALGGSRGDKITELKALDRVMLWHILIVPKIEVSTPYIYGKCGQYLRLTRPEYSVKILTLALRGKALPLIGKCLFNDLEKVSAGVYPQIRRVRKKLLDLGLKSILMSGSGPAMFSITSSRKEAVALRSRLRQENKFWRIFITRTV